MGVKRLTLPAYKDQFPVSVTVFTPTGYSYDSSATVVIINTATGVPQTFYAAFAKYVSGRQKTLTLRWLSKQRVSVITWDYRYIVLPTIIFDELMVGEFVSWRGCRVFDYGG
jgi:hypothetical protein